MQFTQPILAAAWARFAVIFPQWDLQAAYKLMESFLMQTGRLRDGDDRQWYVIEQEWQGLEKAEDERVQFIQYSGGASNLGTLPIYNVPTGGQVYIPLRRGLSARTRSGRRVPRPVSVRRRRYF
jgi:hypothetical protein